jgi:hypothetical protein
MPKQFISYNYAAWDSAERYIYEPIAEQLFICKSDKLKLFEKDKIYVGETWGKSRTTRNRIKFKGIPGYHNYAYFDFLENRPGELRQFQMDTVMDLNSSVVEKPEGRKIDRMRLKNKVLIQALIHKLSDFIGHSNDIDFLDESLTYDVLIEKTLRGTYRKLDIKKEDFTDIGNMPLKEILDNFIKIKNG